MARESGPPSRTELAWEAAVAAWLALKPMGTPGLGGRGVTMDIKPDGEGVGSAGRVRWNRSTASWLWCVTPMTEGNVLTCP